MITEKLNSGIRQGAAFYKEFAALAVPLVLIRVLDTSVNLIDGIFVGQLGEAAIAAVSFCNNFYFMFCLLVFGVCNGTAIFTAQYWGKKDYAGIRRMFGINLILGEGLAVVFCTACLVFSGFIMRLFTVDGEVIVLGSEYLKASALNYLFSTAIFTLASWLKSVERSKFSLLASVVSIVINTLLNYALIYGKAGFPALGVRGSGIATTIARALELCLLAVLAFGWIPFLRGSLKEYFAIEKGFMKRYFKTIYPVTVNQGLYGMGTMLYNTIYGRMGTSVVAAVSIVSIVQKCSTVFMTGAAAAASVLTGREIGAGNMEGTYRNSARLQKIAPLIGIICSSVFLLLTPLIIGAYKVDGTVKSQVYHMAVLLSISIVFNAYNHIGIVGILNSGGDTFYCFILDTIGVWFISLPLLFISGMVFKVSIEAAFGLTLVEIVIKSFFVRWRITRYSWAKNLVSEPQKA